MRSLLFIGLSALIFLPTACSQRIREHTDIIDQTYVHKYGVAVPSDYWTSSGEEGVVVTTTADGVIMTETYSAGVLDGEKSYTFPHSEQIQKREIYRKNELLEAVEYDFDGTPKQKTLYELPTRIRHTVVWYIGGSPKSDEYFDGDILKSGEYYTLSNQRESRVDNFQGMRAIRDDYGQLLFTDNIEGGKLVLRISYHSNGSPREITPYKDGVIEGVKKTFHPGGEPNTIEEWAADKQNGITTIFQNGEKYAEVPYVDGHKKGVERQYRDGSSIVMEITWEDDQKHGPWTAYVGDTVKTDWYYQGQLTTKSSFEALVNRPTLR
jgi:antitoxin component YwqK of YwqJK toxin-antitoxin module